MADFPILIYKCIIVNTNQPIVERGPPHCRFVLPCPLPGSLDLAPYIALQKIMVDIVFYFVITTTVATNRNTLDLSTGPLWCCFPFFKCYLFQGNGQKRDLQVLFWPKTGVPENDSGRECCWPYLIGQHPLSPIFCQKRPGAPGYSCTSQLSSVFGHFMFLSHGLLDYSNRSTWVTRTNFA